MKKSHITLLSIMILIAAAIIGWNIAYPSGAWRYKITVFVETPEGIKSGYAVHEAHAFKDVKIGDSGGGAISLVGEAVVVDLNENGKLFVLLEDPDLTFQVFPYQKGGLTKEGISYYSNLKDGKVSLFTTNKLPRFATFKDLKNQSSVKLINKNDFENTFGQNVNLKDVTMEITDEPVTRSIDQYLPWLKSLNGKYLGGARSSQKAPYGLHAGNFKMGD